MESLDEILEAAKYCLDYKKIENKWEPFNTGGCLGFPGATLLLSLVDSMGSYHRGNKNFQIEIDGNKKGVINAQGWEHFKILNSHYFGLHLSSAVIKQLYKNARDPLTHNSAIKGSIRMKPCRNSLSQGAKAIEVDEKTGVITIFLKEFWELCNNAVNQFKKEDIYNVHMSKIGQELQRTFPTDSISSSSNEKYAASGVFAVNTIKDCYDGQ